MTGCSNDIIDGGLAEAQFLVIDGMNRGPGMVETEDETAGR